MAVNETLEAHGQDDRYFSRAVAKSLFMLDLLNRSPEPLGLNEVAREAGLTKTSAFRLLHTLCYLSFAEQHTGGRYSIGNRGRAQPAMRLAHLLRSTPLVAAEELSKQWNETVSIAVLFNNHIEVVRVFESTRVLRMANTVGRILSPHASSLGKAITAFQTRGVQQQLLLSYGLVRFTPNTITDEKALAREFDETCKRGFSIEDQESTLDGACFGVPLCLKDGSASAGMSVSMPKSRMPTGKERAAKVARLKEAAAAISTKVVKELIEGG